MNHSLSSSTKSALLLAPSLRRATKAALGALLLATAAVGCGAATSDEQAKPVATEQAAQAAQAPEAAAHEHFGMGGVFAEAADKLDLTPQQKQTVAAIRADMQAKSAPVKEARAAFTAALADGVSRGAVDPQALATPLANLSRAAEAAKPALQDAMNRLHAALNADQRAKLVDLVQQQRGEGRKEWKHEEGGMMRGKMKKVAGELGLTSDQLESIKTNLRAAHKAHEGDEAAKEGKHGDRAAMEAKRDEMRAHMQKMGDAFKSESFDARALDVGKEIPAMVSRMAEQSEHFLAIVTPTLTPPQRAKLGAMIQKRGAGMEKAAAVEEEE